MSCFPTSFVIAEWVFWFVLGGVGVATIVNAIHINRKKHGE